jgi:hypothetical protein
LVGGKRSNVNRIRWHFAWSASPRVTDLVPLFVGLLDLVSPSVGSLDLVPPFVGSLDTATLRGFTGHGSRTNADLVDFVSVSLATRSRLHACVYALHSPTRTLTRAPTHSRTCRRKSDERSRFTFTSLTVVYSPTASSATL